MVLNPRWDCRLRKRLGTSRSAGAPLISDGNAIGTLCVTDRVSRQLPDDQLPALRVLSRQAQAQIELRHNLTKLKRALAARDQPRPTGATPSTNSGRR